MDKWSGPFMSIVLILTGIWATVPFNEERATYQKADPIYQRCCDRNDKSKP